MLYRSVADDIHVTKTPHREMIISVGYFFDSFHFRTNWWSCSMLARNFLLCMIFTKDGGNLTPVIKGELGIAVSLAYLYALLSQKPFAKAKMNNVEALFVNAEITVIMFGILFSSDVKFAESELLENMMLLMLLCVYVFADVGVLIRFLMGLQKTSCGAVRVRCEAGQPHFDQTKSIKNMIDDLWAGSDDDAQQVKSALLHRMEPESLRPRLKELLDLRDGNQGNAKTEAERDMRSFVEMCRKLEGLFDDTHALSYLAHDTFWHELSRAFPRTLGWVLHSLSSASTTEFERDKGVIFDVVSSAMKSLYTAYVTISVLLSAL